MGDNNKSLVASVNSELQMQLKDPAAMRALIATTFRGFKNETTVKQACMEAMMRGYSFQDLVKKKIYAIPYGEGYSLVQSISDVRAKAMSTGVYMGKSEPVFKMDAEKIISCTITVKKLIQGHVGEFTAVAHFAEYSTGKQNWASKPHTMISKVAEMHALRMAFPDELSQSYVEEEFSMEAPVDEDKRMDKAHAQSESLKLGNHLKDNKDDKKETTKDPEVEEELEYITEDNQTA